MSNKRDLCEQQLIPADLIMQEILEPMKEQMRTEARAQGKLIEIVDAEWTAKGIILWIAK